MKRSEINSVIREMEELINKVGFALPPFCKWTPEECESKGHEYDEIRDNRLGGGITDYGLSMTRNTRRLMRRNSSSCAMI